MSEKRRDSKGRILRTGESQRPDGRYAYKYNDASGKPQFVYSWRLEPGDRLPQGKREGPSLREKEKQIKRDLEDGVNPRGGEMTVMELVEKYLRQKQGLQPNTDRSHDFSIKIIRQSGFGDRRIDKIKLSDAKEWFIQLQESGKPDGTGYSRGSIKGVRGILRPAFRMAVDDDLIRKNPFDFALGDVLVNDAETREALTAEQERAYLAFVKQDKYYSRFYDAIYALFHTGLRISEFAGLTVADVDLEKQEITVDHQLLRDRKTGYYISDTKTAGGVRKVPMTDDVCACFRRLIANRPVLKVEPIIDGKCGFLFVGRDRMPLTGVQWAWIFGFIWKKYMESGTVPMPKVTPHVCRHTFCTNMAKSGINPKALQYIMGHSNIAVTLNTYTHMGFTDANREFRRVMEGK